MSLNSRYGAGGSHVLALFVFSFSRRAITVTTKTTSTIRFHRQQVKPPRSFRDVTSSKTDPVVPDVFIGLRPAQSQINWSQNDVYQHLDSLLQSAKALCNL